MNKHLKDVTRIATKPAHLNTLPDMAGLGSPAAPATPDPELQEPNIRGLEPFSPNAVPFSLP